MIARPVSYSTILDEHGRRAAEFQCVECGTKGLVTNPKEMPPEIVTKKIIEKGWAAHPFRRTDIYCPKCAGPKPPKRSRWGELFAMASAAPTNPPVEVRQPTPDQRLQIRNYLDKSFDDAAGLYLDNLSDQKIAELVNVPRIIVERVREAAYGPIKVDPVVVGLRAELAGLKQEIETNRATLERVTSKAADIAARLEKVR